MSVKGLAQNVTNISSSKDLHFGEQDSDTTNGSFLNISCTDQNRWKTNYGQRYTTSLIRSGGSRRNTGRLSKQLRRLHSRIHSLSF
ncbi:hypothetical protein [Bartonella capreoli]|uniref:hypothetical protein n=1 Tax=Bartonella capreoli TaxID=155192 RepID=UPI001ABC98FE|nr:hypothetical protein [Bartonella capreoli]